VNTELLKQISSLLEQKAKIVSDLRAPGVDVLQDNAALMQEEEEEGEHMVRVVAQQAREIEAMKAEIFNLKRKEGTHIVPAIPAPSGGLFPPIPKSRRSF
jgi:ribulose 1,5-bisphosphate carboxylase large subunit-like protein